MTDEYLEEEEPFRILDPFESIDLGVSDWADGVKDWAISHRDSVQGFKQIVNDMIVGLDLFFRGVPAIVMIAFLGLLAWQVAGRRTGIVVTLCLIVLGLLAPEAWDLAMTTLAIVSSSVILCFIIGLPLGVFAAKNNSLEGVLRPVLDTMQTIPAFVYLVPVVMLIGIGNVSGVIVTIVFALPPLVRLTSLGIRQVDQNIVEAARAFGATPRQLLFKVELPLATPTIMAGLNQTIMLSLSMVVIASMIAVKGLGNEVLRAMGRLDAGKAIVGGLGIVLLAVVLDRITQGLGQSGRERGYRHWYDIGLASFIVRFVRKYKK